MNNPQKYAAQFHFFGCGSITSNNYTEHKIIPVQCIILTYWQLAHNKMQIES